MRWQKPSTFFPSRVGDVAALPQGALLLQLPRSGPWLRETGSDPMKKSIVALLPLGSSFSPDALLHIHIFAPNTDPKKEQTSVNNGNYVLI